ncbi:hypothetical protein CVT25_013865 [Psilocybe cyanescens]|uniref:DUF6534 domain-containing protein n=1 Tax=Psilocybe cyanescens TaxID=93625 RepID=A0A409XFV9_PSICY|nr:hypothetical protein CVT25_013865 [Psilocybe cyanescens]
MDTLDTTYGAAFIGLIGSAVLYGVTLLQTFLYFKQYPNDSRFTKIIIFGDKLQQSFCASSINLEYECKFWSSFTVLLTDEACLKLQTDCNGLIGLIVECFFARRVWIMSGNFFITGIIVILACIHCGEHLVFTVEGYLYSGGYCQVSEANSRLFSVPPVVAGLIDVPATQWVTSTGLGSAAAADIIIAVSLCYYLTKSRTGFARTDSLISTLIVYSLTTGLITSVIAFICVVTVNEKDINIGLTLNRLNSRESLREQAAPQEGTFLQLTPFRAVASAHVSQCAEPSSPGANSSMEKDALGQYADNPLLNVKVQTQTFTRSDTDFEYIVSPVRSLPS